MAYCAYCRTRVLKGDRKCPSCGSTVFWTDDEPPEAPAPAPAPEPHVVYVERPAPEPRVVYGENPARAARSERSWLTALLLCVFGGGLGLHRFYVGKIGTGILYLLTGGGYGLGWLIDLIVIACGNFRDKEGLLLRNK